MIQSGAGLRWALLICLTGLFSGPLVWARLPAAFMLGAIAAGIVLQTTTVGLKLPAAPRMVAEALLGAMISEAITPVALTTFLHHAPLFLGVVGTVILASSLMGWLLFRLGILPGTTAIWGLSPGAAQAMMLMAGSFGADARLVALMQYLRVLIVATIAPLVARLWVTPAGAAHVVGPASHFDGPGFAMALAVAATGLALAIRFPFPAGTILIPMAIGGVLHVTGLVPLYLPDPLLAITYVVLGWSIGLSFTLPVLRHALHVLPQVTLAILALVALSGGLAVLLAFFDGIDPLTAYLATSPGGMSSVAIIAATSHVDLAFVISLQTVRFLLVLAVGPAISRFITERVKAD
ncbi:MAG: AbrB family transcriptional regulator [Paracoccaceae bacterium]|nr:AbrB family transcriptional regulator [Paracoccaceae bacterium]